MKNLFTPKRLVLFLAFALAVINSYAQAPNISYSSPQVFNPNTAVPGVTPSNSGGAVATLTTTTFTTLAIGNGVAVDLAVDAAGNVYMAYGSTVQKFSPDGSTITTIGSGFNDATGVAVDAAGNVYVADYQNGPIKEIPAGGGPYFAVGPSFTSAYRVALDAAGNIYVCDRLNNAVKKMPPGGGTPVTIGSGFNNPRGIAVDAAGNVYVADRGNYHVKEIPVGGGSVIAVNTTPITASLDGIVVDAGGNVYFDDDAGLDAIHRIPAGGGPIADIGGQFRSATGLAIDASGDIYVGDTGNKDIKVITAGGYYINRNLPAGLSLNMTTGVISGTTNVRSPATDYRVTAYNSSGLSNTTINIAVVSSPLPSVSYSSPQVYTVGTAITPLSPTASGVSPAGTYSTPVVIGAGLSNPIGVAVDHSGKVYVAENQGNAIKMVPIDGSTPVAIGSGFKTPTGVAIDAAGNIYVADDGNNCVKEIPVGGGAIITLAGGLPGPYGIALDASNNIYVTTPGNNTVKEIPAGGGTAITLGTGFSTPTGIALDAAGNIYVTDRGHNAIKRMPPGGGSTFTIASGNGNPNGIVVDAAGNVYYADTNNSSIKEIPAAGGATISLGSGLTTPQGIALDNAGSFYLTSGSGVQIINPGGYAINPTLPAGLSFDKSSGTVSGTPTATSPATNYTVTAYNNNGSSTATVNIKVAPTNSSLSNLTMSSGTLSPAFTGTTTSYTTYVDNAVTSITETPTVATTGATVTVNGTTVASGSASAPIALAVGPNTITTVVTAPGGGATTTYTVTVNRLDVYLTNLKVNNGAISISPAFHFSTTNYTASVPNATTSVKILAALAYSGSSFTVNGMAETSGTASASIPLATGPNTITTVVTGADGVTTFTYTLTITRAYAASDANLSNLTISSGTLSPVFATGTTSYTAYVGNATASVMVTPTVEASGSTVTVNGTTVASGAASAPITLAVGPNTITTVVTAPDGTTTSTYTVTVNRLNLYLTNLQINGGSIPISPAFHYSTTSYTASVPNTTTSVKILAALAYSGSSFTVNGMAETSGTASASIPLSVGANTIKAIVTGADGVTTFTYTVTVTRAPSNNSSLSNLTVSDGTLSPAFASGTTSYTTSVNAASVTVTPTVAGAGTTVTVNGAPVASGSPSGAIALTVGANTVTTVVTAQDGSTTSTYTVTVTRLSNNAYLSNLEINGGSIPLTPAFHYSTTSYTASVANTATSVKILLTTADATATVKVNGVTVTSGTASAPIALAVGPNTINALVTAQNGTTTDTYTITVTRSAPVADFDEVVSVEEPVQSPGLENDGIVVHQGVSPNGDGINDVLLVDGITNYPENRLLIMNRNGALVYEAKGYDNTTKAFDGHSNKTGTMQLPGTYFYALDYTVKGISKHKTGFIILKY